MRVHVQNELNDCVASLGQFDRDNFFECVN